MLDLTVTLYYTAFYDVDVITRSVRVTNHAKEPVYLTKVFSTALDLDAEDYRMLTLHGSWARDRIPPDRLRKTVCWLLPR